jgi:hypothetical protein
MRRRRRRRVLLVGGMVAFGAHKMSQKDAERIEQHTGVDPEELTDEELEQAMGELGIEQQQVTPEDQEHTDGAAPASGGGDLDELQKLGELHAQGILTDEEFAAKKAQILGL